MKLTDMIISAVLKRGILYESREVDVEIFVPITTEEDTEKQIKIRIKSPHITLRVEKEEV